MKDAHNKSIVGKGNVWYDMSYDDAIKQTLEKGKVEPNLATQEDETESEKEKEESATSFLNYSYTIEKTYLSHLFSLLLLFFFLQYTNNSML
ncbi:hypothetical protein ARALYDRAFT_909533 [Arabidopsis lyrata subsp. lyrata]|uniref:Uncharacterized protein n=1 Tax=Arabidopsis lyrata subsp. lyrata TaxID=81972 RepID=D7M7E2_ARALL|nr:hypothetical protein ARALYDRAFT_909533 [Arabidopsis lyrata subsp. lyrata]